jgi:Phytanoyl-CoA dioxygenase (PhyH)
MNNLQSAWSEISTDQEKLNYCLSPEQLALLPTTEDVEFFHTHGWFITKKVIPDELIDAAIVGSEQFYLGKKDAILPSMTGYSNWQPGDDDRLRNNEFVSLQKKELRQLALYPMIGAIAARLSDSTAIRLFEDQLVYKAPSLDHRKGSVGWHADYAYSSNCTSDKLMAAWIPFHDSVVDRSPLMVLDGSHRWSNTEHLREFNQPDLSVVVERFAQAGHQIVEVPMVMEKGQISFHHCRTIHGSYPNFSDEVRLAMAVHVQDRDNCYQPYWNNGQPIQHYLDGVCRLQPNGEPDYSDPIIFPMIWSDVSA